jgi:hypothetical protein
VLKAHPDFMLAISYNPGYQSVLKDLKQSTRQRFTALQFDYPPAELEARIVAEEGGVPVDMAERLVTLAGKIRNLREQGLTEGASTRLLIYAAQLIRSGIAPARACRTAVCLPLTDDDRLQETLADLITGSVLIHLADSRTWLQHHLTHKPTTRQTGQQANGQRANGMNIEPLEPLRIADPDTYVWVKGRVLLMNPRPSRALLEILAGETIWALSQEPGLGRTVADGLLRLIGFAGGEKVPAYVGLVREAGRPVRRWRACWRCIWFRF